MHHTAIAAHICAKKKAYGVNGTFLYAGGAAPSVLGIFYIGFARIIKLYESSGTYIPTFAAAYAFALIYGYAHKLSVPPLSAL